MLTHRILPRRLAALAVLLAGFAVAAPARAVVIEGRPACDYCRMLLEQPRFGGEVGTASFERRIFDSAECMAAYWITQRADTSLIFTMRVVRYDRPSEKIDAKKAVYLRSASRKSPMGLDLSAYASAAAADSARRKNPGAILRWPAVLELVAREWHLGKRP